MWSNKCYLPNSLCCILNCTVLFFFLPASLRKGYKITRKMNFLNKAPRYTITRVSEFSRFRGTREIRGPSREILNFA